MTLKFIIWQVKSIRKSLEYLDLEGERSTIENMDSTIENMDSYREHIVIPWEETGRHLRRFKSLFNYHDLHTLWISSWWIAFQVIL